MIRPSALLVLLLLGTVACRRAADNPHAVPVSEASFDADVRAASGLVLVDFWADWCPPCRSQQRVLAGLGPAYAGRVKFCQVDVDENPALADRFLVEEIPLLVLYRDGRVLGASTGLKSEAELRTWLDRHLD